jgi:hypothetical protein
MDLNFVFELHAAFVGLKIYVADGVTGTCNSQVQAAGFDERCRDTRAGCRKGLLCIIIMVL